MFQRYSWPEAFFLFLAVSFSVAPLTTACIWDHDTIAMEKARFPEVIDIISGNFPRHSREFHEWRITRTKDQLEKAPDQLALHDDLAVSQHKLGDHAAAMATMKAKEAIRPGIYETYSNMGTFLIYTGELPRSLNFINKALSINPEAHFGREKYQKWLVEWVIAGRPTLSDKPGPNDHAGFAPSGYAAFILSKQPVTAKKILTEPSRQKAIKGVLGMMRFADFDNPVLQEALGDLLLAGPADANTAHLASIAYLHASKKAPGPADQERIIGKFHAARSTAIGPKFDANGASERFLENELKEALDRGEKLAASVRADELAWIKDGKDVSGEFARKYLAP